HPIAIHGVAVDLRVDDDAVAITATVRTADRTGVEMEALTAVSVAALTVVDMVKAVDPGAVITDVRVEEKTGGVSGDWNRGAAGEVVRSDADRRPDGDNGDTTGAGIGESPPAPVSGDG